MGVPKIRGTCKGVTIMVGTGIQGEYWDLGFLKHVGYLAMV